MSYDPDPGPYYDGGQLRTVVDQPVVDVAPAVVQPVAPVQPVVVAPAATVPVERTSVATTFGRRYAFDSVIVGIVGLVLTIVGLVAMARGGFDGSMRTPVVSVLGFSHTTSLGMIEAAIGILLIISAASMSRSAAVFFGLVLGVGAVVGAVQTSSFRGSLALESGWAWLCAIAAAIVVLVSLIMPRVVTTTSRVQSV